MAQSGASTPWSMLKAAAEAMRPKKWSGMMLVATNPGQTEAVRTWGRVERERVDRAREGEERVGC